MKLKKLVALILALVTALSLVACGSGGNGSGGGASTDGDTSNFPKMTWSAATSGAEGSNFDVGLEKFSELLQEMYNDFISVCLDPVMNQAAKLHYMTGGQVKIPMVLRAPMGTGRRGAAQHSQNMESLFAHIPGLKLVCPSTPEDAKGLLKTAIRDDDPVVFLEHKLLYPQKVETPDEVAPIPLGSARTRREGTDLTILTWARQVNFSLEAAETLAADGVSTEVIDLRSLVPLDWDAIRDSVSKTHRVLIVEEDVKRCGFGAELSAQITEDLFDQLDAPVRRVAALNSSVPFCAELEDEIYPNPERIAAAAAALVRE